MICINKDCQACKDHFVNQVVYKECYSDKEFITNCETHNKLEELTETKGSCVHKEGGITMLSKELEKKRRKIRNLPVIDKYQKGVHMREIEFRRARNSRQ